MLTPKLLDPSTTLEQSPQPQQPPYLPLDIKREPATERIGRVCPFPQHLPIYFYSVFFYAQRTYFYLFVHNIHLSHASLFIVNNKSLIHPKHACFLCRDSSQELSVETSGPISVDSFVCVVVEFIHEFMTHDKGVQVSSTLLCLPELSSVPEYQHCLHHSSL